MPRFLAALLLATAAFCLIAATAAADTHFVSLGDSYSSGEGAGPFDKGTATHADNCHRSANAWPRLLGVTSGTHLACSGATTKDFYVAQHKVAPDNVGQLNRLAALAARGPIGTVLVGIGGNDMKFASIMQDCLIKSCLKQMDKVELPRLRNIVGPAVTKTLRDTVSVAGGARVVLVGYPDIVPGPGHAFHHCGWLTDKEKPRIWRLEAALDGTMSSAAAAANVPYISVRPALAGHEMCTANSWVRPVGTLRVWPLQEQGHPNVQGQRAIAKMVQAGLVSLKPSPSTTPSQTGPYLYYSRGSRIMRASRSGSGGEAALLGTGTSDVTSITATGDSIYWTDGGNTSTSGSLWMASSDGSNPHQILGDLGFLPYVVVAGGHLFVLDDHHGLSRADLDGSNVQWGFIPAPGQQFDGQDQGVGDGLTTDGTYLYFSRCFDNSIARSDLAGQDVETDFVSLTRSECPQAISTDGQHIYWGTLGTDPSQDPSRIGRADMDGSNADAYWFLTGDELGPYGVLSDGQFIYWTHNTSASGPSYIGRVGVDGTGSQSSFVSGTGTGDQVLGTAVATAP